MELLSSSLTVLRNPLQFFFDAVPYGLIENSDSAKANWFLSVLTPACEMK